MFIKCLFVATVSTGSAVFIETLPVYPSIIVDVVLVLGQQKSHLWKVPAAAGYLAWMPVRGAERQISL